MSPGHGGLRLGAGRKRVLEEDERWWVAARCEALRHEQERAKRKADLAQHLEPRGIAENNADIRDVSHLQLSSTEPQNLPEALRQQVDPRSGLIRARALVVHFGAIDRDANYPEDLEDNIVSAIEAVRGNARSLDCKDGRTPPLGRVFTPKHARPREFRRDIVE